jgi:hypothetical protein
MKPIRSVGLFLMMAGVAPAIVVEDYSVATNAPPDLNWDYVYNYKSSSAVAVGTHWLLTAAHVADDGGTGAITVGTTTYTQQEIIFHDTADLALVRYDREFPGFYPLYTGEIYTTKWGLLKTYVELVMVGFGFDGVASDSSFTQGSSDGVKRWGTNKGEAEAAISADISDDGIADVSTKCFRMDFNLDESNHEAGANKHDSGGPVFINNNGTWALTGINLYRTGPVSGPYTGNYSAMIHDYNIWIESVVVETNDFDSDGIPNGWEWQFGSITGVTATADQDDDGFTGEQEYLADTDPTDGESFFFIGTFTASTNQIVTFNGSTERFYQLYVTTNDLADAGLTWTPVYPDPVPGSGSNTVLTATNHTPAAFYRLSVSQ